MTPESTRKQVFAQVKKLVIKIGTGVLTSDAGSLDLNAIASICRQVHGLIDRGMQVIVVTSGAIGAGIGALGLQRRPSMLPELQAAAAVGQNRLMVAYDEALKKYGHHAGQVLLTRQDLEVRRRFVNVGNTIRALLQMGTVPIINENDTVSTEEIKFGGNDVLAAQVLHVLRADAMIFLSTVDGLYDKDNNVIDIVDKVSPETFEMDTGKKSELGIGGMHAKLEIIQQINNAGEPVILLNGRAEDAILEAVDGQPVGTLFCPGESRLCGRKRWLRFSVEPRGTITVDQGAVAALVKQNKSLLASGISRVEGVFQAGDLVAVCDDSGTEVARGLTNYSAGEVDAIKGAQTSEIESKLGYKYYDEVIHRDDLVVVE